jgi:C1A family cysteine protease
VQSHGIVFGFAVYESFRTIKADGLMPLPLRGEKLLGGHCVYAVGYDPIGVICRNSWGVDWGKRGHFTMPWSFFLSSNVADLWVVSQVETMPFGVIDPRA